MRVALIHNAKFPVAGYGGTERVVWWLAKGLNALGHQVILVCEPGSSCPFAQIKTIDFSLPVEGQLPRADLYHYFNTPPCEPKSPYVVTIGGNGRFGETYLPNTAFVSHNQAARHGAQCYVHNGLDPDEYEFESTKSSFFLFLAKASWKVKNVQGAIQLTRAHGGELKIIGGSRPWLPHWRGVYWEGVLAGPRKAKIVAHARALLNPIQWNEPFGLAVIEAMVSGTPVIASRRGSMAEIVNSDTGRLCESKDEFLAAMGEITTLSPDRCRDRVLSLFHFKKMAESYTGLYEKVLSGKRLNEGDLCATEPPEKLIPLTGF